MSIDQQLQDQESAAKLVRETGYRCVTLEGDDFNPGGTLTGGSRRSGGGCLGFRGLELRPYSSNCKVLCGSAGPPASPQLPTPQRLTVQDWVVSWE